MTQVVRRLTDAADQCVHKITKISHFQDIEGKGIWVVLVLAEAIPESSWNRINMIIHGNGFCLNPQIETNRKTIKAFQGVILNFGHVSVDLLENNELPMSNLPKVIFFLFNVWALPF